MSATTPPSQICFIHGNLIDVRIYPAQILAALSRGELTLNQLAEFGTALNDSTTALRWLLDHPDAQETRDLMEELTLPDFR
ncbi:hypothetical protein UO65_2978 [Actinokineospora spheciospongiae]|uniref:Uncharacterized protein n=1 Tax=Actinokineospora spheciospongiae TaxID=909613 RepID=W7IL57_9PSEU|nr:hypothetical protein [Actinokineospora spheciospongiae]EWC61620.1 hypothetical protein UO65_2978 [Actinokineospora spheciospongiae]PWW62314.1 hypothetical protein DFQ13_105124 [Actinokineospora spheciospongiae]